MNLKVIGFLNSPPVTLSFYSNWIKICHCSLYIKSVFCYIWWYIHYFSNKTHVYKCIFGGPYLSNKLAQIFNNVNWGTKYYNRNKMILVVTNLDDIDRGKSS